MNTLLSQRIESADAKELYDETCKQILANKQILAWIMKSCIPEYRDVDVIDIAEKYIEGIPDVGNINIATGENITGMSNENINMVKSKNFYDIRYRALAPCGDGFVELLINIEAQNKHNPGYSLLKRAVNYVANMVAEQYGTVFSNSEYDKLKKVYSIWICRNVPKRLKNSINIYEMKERQITGNAKFSKVDYDLTSIIMVYLGNEFTGDDVDVLKLLNTLLSADVRAKEKIEFLENEFNIKKNEKLEREAKIMCNLSDGVEEAGIVKGAKTERKRAEEEKLEIAKKLLASGISIEIVTNSTGIPVETIQSLS